MSMFDMNKLLWCIVALGWMTPDCMNVIYVIGNLIHCVCEMSFNSLCDIAIRSYDHKFQINTYLLTHLISVFVSAGVVLEKRSSMQI